MKFTFVGKVETTEDSAESSLGNLSFKSDDPVLLKEIEALKEDHELQVVVTDGVSKIVAVLPVNEEDA